MTYIIVTLIVLLLLIKLVLLIITKQCKSKVCLIGKTAIVTGANTGIGFETALDFAHRGAKVILACRNPAKAEDARNRIINITHNPNVVVKFVDMSSLKSVRAFAKEINQNEETLDILVNNAGAGGMAPKLTEDGLELTMQVNYFAPFLLTVLLTDLLKKSAPSRVVNVSSYMAKFACLNPNDLNKRTGITMAYSNSKLCQIFFTKELAARLKSFNVSVFSVHPGAVRTEIFKRIQGFRKLVLDFFYNFYFKSAEEGAQTVIYTAVENYLESYTGEHFSECQVVSTYKTAQDKNLQKKIWEMSQKLVQLRPDEFPY